MKKHILTIDDEPEVCELLTQALEAGGYRVSAANSCDRARQIVKEDPPQLVICDLQMEDADGLELISSLKALLPNLPVILLTGVIFDREVIRETLSKKVSCCLEKTVSLQKVLQEVRRLLGDLQAEPGQDVNAPCKPC